MRLMERIHNRLGEFWFNSLMLFCAQRIGDFMNVFVGLYLVPKYIGLEELGAVLPLTSFGACLILPAWIFAMAFMKELNSLASQRRFGQMKSLMRGVFICAGIVLVVAIVLTKLFFPFFLTKMRIQNGSLALIIVGGSFVGCVAPIYSNAMQALKKFRAMSILGVLSAPLRLVTMLLAMPFRPISGYFLGQNIGGPFTILTSIFVLRKELSVPAEPYWKREVFKRLGFLFIGMALYQFAGAFTNLIEQTALRGRIPGVESAAYYMVTRFSDITNFLSSTLLVTLFPYTSELADRGESTRPLVLKSSLLMIAFAALLAVFFALAGEPILRFLPSGEEYAPFYWAIPWMIGISTLISLQNFHTNTEVSAGRFRFLAWWIPVNIVYPVALALSPLPSLKALLTWQTAACLVKLAFCVIDLARQTTPPCGRADR